MASKNSLLYIGHSYHKKTQSTKFLLDLFSTYYVVDEAVCDDKSSNFRFVDNPHNDIYDVLVLFQMPIPVTTLQEKFEFRIGNYFPMYDGTGEMSDEFWLGYKNFNIINFSKTLHNRLKAKGFSSFYIQYFPKPEKKIINWGNKSTAFFWERTSKLTIKTITPLLNKMQIKTINLHACPDPDNVLQDCSLHIANNIKINYSHWFSDRNELKNVIMESAIYFAPRCYEGIGMSFLEAMAAGRCVVAINHPTMNEYISQGINGLLYDKNDLSFHIKKYDIQQIQEKAYEYIAKGYSMWKEEKYKILEWVRTPPQQDKKLLYRTENEINISESVKFGWLILISKQKNNRIYIFNKFVIPKNLANTIMKCVYRLKLK